MAVKYVDDFEFPKEAGFTGSAGKESVRGYMRGGRVRRRAYNEGGEAEEEQEQEEEKEPKPQPEMLGTGAAAKAAQAMIDRKKKNAATLDAVKKALGIHAKGGRVESYAKGGKKKWIQGAIKHPGALRKSMGVKAGQKIPAKKLAAAAKKKGVTGRRARLAQTLRKLGKAEGGTVSVERTARRVAKEAVSKHVRAAPPKGHGVK